MTYGRTVIIMWCIGMKFDIEIFDPVKHTDQINEFFAVTDVSNNKDMDHLGYYKRKDSKLFLTISDSKIIAMCYAHDFSEYYPDTWRIFTRTATLPEYRSKGFPRSRTMISAAGINAYSCASQVDYAFSMGAKNIVFTTNTIGGSITSQKLSKYLTKIEPIDPRFSYFDTKHILGCDQIVWRLNYRNLFDLTTPI